MVRQVIRRLTAFSRRFLASKCVVGEDYPVWTPGHRTWLERVLKEPCGKDLMRILYADLQAGAFATHERSIFEVGKSAGISALIGHIEALAAPMPPEEGHEDGTAE